MLYLLSCASSFMCIWHRQILIHPKPGKQLKPSVSIHPFILYYTTHYIHNIINWKMFLLMLEYNIFVYIGINQTLHCDSTVVGVHLILLYAMLCRYCSRYSMSLAFLDFSLNCRYCIWNREPRWMGIYMGKENEDYKRRTVYNVYDTERCTTTQCLINYTLWERSLSLFKLKYFAKGKKLKKNRHTHTHIHKKP